MAVYRVSDRPYDVGTVCPGEVNYQWAHYLAVVGRVEWDRGRGAG